MRSASELICHKLFIVLFLGLMVPRSWGKKNGLSGFGMCGEELTKCVVDDLVHDKCAVVNGQVCQVPYTSLSGKSAMNLIK